MRTLNISLLLLFAVSFASAQSRVIKAETPDSFALRVAKAFESKRLGSLDRTKPTSVKVVIEHSLGDGDDEFERRTFRSLKGVQSWLVSKMSPQASFEGGRLKRCRTGRCDFAIVGMLHNHLYLTRFTFGRSHGSYYLKTIRFTDGD